MKNIHKRSLAACVGFLTFVICLSALSADPGPERLVSREAVLLVTIPDFQEAKEAFLREPVVRLFEDTAMKSFLDQFDLLADQFLDKALEEMNESIGMDVEELCTLLQGQLTLALFADWDGRDDLQVGMLLLVDCGDEAEKLAMVLDSIGKEISGSGRATRPMTIRGHSFDAAGSVEEGIGKGLVFGQVDSLFIASTSIPPVEVALAGLSGDLSSTLSRDTSFVRIHADRLSGAQVYGWLNFHKVYGYARTAVERMDRELARNPNPIVPKPSSILRGLGFGGIESMAFGYDNTEQGSLIEMSLDIPQDARKGVFEWLTWVDKDVLPPEYIPADVQDFSRSRMDLRKTIENFNRGINELAPGLFAMISMTAGGQQDPEDGIQSNVFDRLGDDIISFGLPPRSSRAADLAQPPLMLLVGSSEPGALVQYCADLVVPIVASMGIFIEKRDFDGHTVYALEQPGITFYFSSDDRYVLVSSEERLMRDYFRKSITSSRRSLRDVEGMAEAVRTVGPDSLGSFYYNDSSDLIGRVWEGLRQNPVWIADFIKELADLDDRQVGDVREFLTKAPVGFSRLPPFNQVAEYFHFNVAGTGSNDHYLSFRIFAPISPELR